MKTVQFSISRVAKVGFALLFAAFTLSAVAQTAEKTAKVIRVSGNARYQTASGQWAELKVGDLIKPGTVVQTAQGSTLDLLLDGEVTTPGFRSAASPNSIVTGIGQPFPTPTFPGRPTGSLVRLEENTVISIDKLTSTGTGADRVSETMLDLRAGKIFGSTPKVAGASKYEIKLPNGVAAVRGTIYTIGTDGTVNVLSGNVFVTIKRPDGTTVTQQVPAGNSFNPVTGVMDPLTDAQAQALLAGAQDSGRVLYGAPTSFTTDGNSVIWVSPITEAGNPIIITR